MDLATAGVRLFWLLRKDISSHAVRRIFAQQGLDVISIEESSRGIEQRVKIVGTSGGKYVLKMPRDPSQLASASAAARLCEDHAFDAPRLAFACGEYLIERFVEGTPLSSIPPGAQRLEEWRSAGMLLRRLHGIRLERHGQFCEGGSLPHATQGAFNDARFQRDHALLRERGPLSEEDLERGRKYYEDVRGRYAGSAPVLTHQDVFAAHIICLEGRVTLIDFGDAKGSAPMDDFAFPYIRHGGTPEFEALVTGYGGIERDEARFYAFLRIMRRFTRKELRFDRERHRIVALYRDIVAR